MGVNTLGPRRLPLQAPTTLPATATTTIKEPAPPPQPTVLPVQVPKDGYDGLTSLPKQPLARVVGELLTVPRRRLPPLRDALVDPAFPALSLAQVKVPADVVDVLAAAKKVLVIGHARPADGDCVGSALGLMRGLQALGKEAVAVVDQDLPASLRALDPAGQLQRAKDVLGQDFDLVVMVDVAQAGRTGDMAAVVSSAKNVMVIDHHDERDPKKALGLGPDARLTPWIDVDFDAAAGQVGAAVHAVASAVGGDADAAVAAVADVVAAGLYTDTLGFTAPGADASTMALFKGLAINVMGSGKPAQGLTFLDGLEERLAARLPDDVVKRLDHALVSCERRGPMGAERVLGVKPDGLTDALQALQAHDPRAVVGDVTGRFLNALDDAAAKPGCRHALLVLPGDDGGWRVSVRGEAALEVCRRVSGNGGGKPGAAVALLSSAEAPTLEAAIAVAQRALKDHALTASSLLRVGR